MKYHFAIFLKILLGVKSGLFTLRQLKVEQNPETENIYFKDIGIITLFFFWEYIVYNSFETLVSAVF